MTVKEKKLVLNIWFKFYYLFKFNTFTIGDVHKRTKSEYKNILKNIEFLEEYNLISKKSTKSKKYSLLFPDKFRKDIYELEKERLLGIINNTQKKIDEIDKLLLSIK